MPADISRYTDSCEYPSGLIEKFCYYWCKFSMIYQIRKNYAVIRIFGSKTVSK